MEFKRLIWNDYSAGQKRFTTRRITFFEYPQLLRLEIKYYLATRLSKKTISPSSLWSDYQFMLKYFIHFLQEAYPQVNSFSEIMIEEMLPAWLDYIALSGRKSSRQGYRAQIYQLYLFFSDFMIHGMNMKRIFGIAGKSLQLIFLYMLQIT